MFDTDTVEGFWEFHNSNCWKIKRLSIVDFYLFLPTMKYLYKTCIGKKWNGTLDPTLGILKTEEERRETIEFESEIDALDWFVSNE